MSPGTAQHSTRAGNSLPPPFVAVPVGSPETCGEFEQEVDETICAIAPDSFHAVGQYYEDFSQTTDDEVRELLAAAAREFKSQNE